MTVYGLAGKPLTDREMEVLVGIAEGRSDAAIGRAMGISHTTVKGHIGRIKEKVHAESRPHMVAIAYQRGLLRCSSLGSVADRLLLVQAAWHVVNAQHASTLYIERKLHCGPQTAMKLLNQLEGVGVVGPTAGELARTVYVGGTGTVRFYDVLAAIGTAA